MRPFWISVSALLLLPACAMLGTGGGSDPFTTIDILATTHVRGVTKPCT